MMFTLSDFKIARQKSPETLEDLLKHLQIDPKDLDDEALDDLIDKKICERMKSNSILSGCVNLLDRGEIEFEVIDTIQTLIRKILENREEIKHPPKISIPGSKSTDFELLDYKISISKKNRSKSKSEKKSPEFDLTELDDIFLTLEKLKSIFDKI